MGILLRILHTLFSRRKFFSRAQEKSMLRARLWFIMVAMPQMLIEYNKICKSGQNHGLGISSTKFKAKSRNKNQSSPSFSPGKLLGVAMKRSLRRKKSISR